MAFAFDKTKLKQQAMTLAISVAGVAVFHFLNLPLPFLFGPMLGSLIAALLGARLRGAGPVSVGARTILGIAVGASITPAVIGQVPHMLASVALIPLYIVVIALVGIPYFYRICRFDLPTAYYAAMPGGLQDMVIFGAEAGGNVRALSLVHATRVLVIVSIAPIILVQGMGADLSHPIGAPAASLPVHEMAVMVLVAFVGWKGGERIGLFGASILGPMILTAILSLTGVIHSRPPAEAILFAQFFIGMGIGVGYVGVTLDELKHFVLSGIVYVLILAVVAAGFTEIVVLAGFAEQREGFLAFAPGGQAEMTVLSIIAGADLGFVVVHHLTRIVTVITGAPIIAHLLKVRDAKKQKGG